MSDLNTQKIREGLSKITAWAVTVVKHLEELEKKEIPMGKAADAINDLQATVTTQASTIASLQTQLADAEANEYDAADEAAIAGVLSPASATPSPAPATPSPAPATPAPAPVAIPAGFAVNNGIVTDTAGKTVYAYSGTTTPDATAWPSAGTYNGQAVYYFSGDTSAGQATGVSAGVWATIPAPGTGSGTGTGTGTGN